MPEFSARGEVVDGTGVLRLHGQLDGAAEDALGIAWDEATVTAPAVVVLDLGDVSYINSTGIALVVGLLARARAESRELRAARLTPHYRHIFELTRIADLVSCHASVADAVGGVVELR